MTSVARVVCPHVEGHSPRSTDDAWLSALPVFFVLSFDFISFSMFSGVGVLSRTLITENNTQSMGIRIRIEYCSS